MALFTSELARLELANDLIASMVGSKRIAIVEARERQDEQLISSLREEKSALLREQRLINFGDKEMRDKCIREYGPILKAEFESLKKNSGDSCA
jgi:hypothetical protein